jgi:uncharacterized protein YndB with AHSA1/START domain
MSADTIELTKRIQAPPETVFRALTDAGELTKWFPSSAESDPRPGGAFTYKYEFDDSSKNHVMTNKYEDVTPSRRVSYPWKTPHGMTHVEFTLESRDGETELRLVHSGWRESDDWQQSKEMHREGWGFFLDNLKSYLERGEDKRAEAMQMRTPARV